MIALSHAQAVASIRAAARVYVGQDARAVRCRRRGPGEFVCSFEAVGPPAGMIESASCTDCTIRTYMAGVDVVQKGRYVLVRQARHGWRVRFTFAYRGRGHGLARGQG